jgi:hypothetical protein
MFGLMSTVCIPSSFNAFMACYKIDDVRIDVRMPTCVTHHERNGVLGIYLNHASKKSLQGAFPKFFNDIF